MEAADTLNSRAAEQAAKILFWVELGSSKSKAILRLFIPSLDSNTEFPFVLIPGKETQEALTYIGERIEREMKECKTSELTINLENIRIKPEIRFTQNDGKMLSITIQNVHFPCFIY